jgi:CTP:molybdopterin cytidylyltransferase MocA
MLAKISEHLAFDPEAPTEKQKVSESKKTKSPLPRDSDFRFSSNNSGVESGSTVRAAAGLKATMAPSPTAGHFLFGDQPWIEKRTVNDQYSISIDQVRKYILENAF